MGAEVIELFAGPSVRRRHRPRRPNVLSAEQCAGIRPHIEAQREAFAGGYAETDEGARELQGKRACAELILSLLDTIDHLRGDR